jgi:hypothetical protein
VAIVAMLRLRVPAHDHLFHYPLQPLRLHYQEQLSACRVTSSSLIVIPMFSQVYAGPQLVISLRGGSQGAFLQLFV